MIELKNISHSYGKNKVLENLNLNIETNKLTCLLGSSGSGKTTILRLIAGLELPINGKILVNNLILTEKSDIIIPSNKRKLGFVFQDLALWPHFTVYKNVAFGLTERKEKDVKKNVIEMLDFFGIKEQANKYPHQLSGGQQQLVAISRSLVLRPDILLMDEPLANLDVKLKRKILEYLIKLKEKFNITIVYVTHDHREAFAISDNIIVLKSGKIEEIGTSEQIKNSDNEYVKYFLEY